MKNKTSDLNQGNELDNLQELLLGYVEKVRKVKPRRENIFKTESSKSGLENKVWHFFHKVEASRYHRDRVMDLTSKVRKDLIKIASSGIERAAGNTTEMRVSIQDRKILFEIDAFFAAGRSALDFSASIISRYIRGKNTDRFKRTIKILENNPHPVATLVNKIWEEWAEDFIDYRDYLLHQGVLPTPSGSHMKIASPKSTNSTIAKITKIIQGGQGGPVIFPLPVKPNPRFRLTLEDILGLDEPELPLGIIETRATVSFSSAQDYQGPKVRVSLGRGIGSESINIASESYLGKSDQVRSIRYELAPGYVEADTLCRDLYKRLVELGFELFTKLKIAGFTHIA
jgi:hypothetical protein